MVLGAIELYCGTINSFVTELSDAALKSRGFLESVLKIRG